MSPLSEFVGNKQVGLGCEQAGQLEKRRQDLTLTADAHFVLPAALCLTFADGTVDEPAKLSSLKLPGWTFFAAADRTFFYYPAWFWFFLFDTDSGQEKEYLPFHMGGNRAPALFIAVYGFNRNANQFSQLLLGLV